MASHYFSAQSNPFYSTRASLPSIFAGRRSSSVSVLSERRTSYQYGTRCTDVSVGLERGNAITDNHNLVRKVHFRTPTHEHSGADMLAHHAVSHLDVTQLNSSTTVGMDISANLNASELPSILYMQQLLEEPKSPPNPVFRHKTTEV